MDTVTQLLTEHLDTWTATVQTKTSAGRGGGKKRELYGIKKLRELILELAVRGLLVPQDPNDEPASELLKQAIIERKRLQNGKLIKSITPAPVAPEEQPYVIPSNWRWARFPELCHYGPGKTPSTKNPSFWEGDDGIPWVSIADMKHFGTVTQTTKRVTKVAAEKVFQGEAIKAGTILMSFKLTVGKIARLGLDAFHNEAILSITPFTGILEDYIFKFLPTRALAGNTKKAIMGNTLNATSLSLLLIPLPPLAEQHRIVAKVDELMALCDQLEQQQSDHMATHELLVKTLLDALVAAASDAEQWTAAWQRIAAHFDALFTTEASIDQLKQTILQLAVMGKLVEQDPEDEPASELLKKIAAEKERLIKEKKIKNQPKLLPVSEGEFPFPPPSGWQFARIGNLTSKLGSGSTPRGGKSAYVEEGIIFLRSQNVWNDGLKLEDTAYIPDETHEIMNNTQVFPRDVLLNITGASLGRSTIFPENLVTANVSQHVTIIRLVELEMADFLHLGILSPLVQKLVWGRQVGMAIEGLSKKVLEKFEFPIPPLAEQQRIVAKVDELMALCDALKAKLGAARATQRTLTDSLVEQAVG